MGYFFIQKIYKNKKGGVLVRDEIRHQNRGHTPWVRVLVL